MESKDKARIKTMSIFNWKINFTAQSFENLDFEDIYNWVSKENLPVAFLAIRKSSELKRFEFGYFNKETGQWISNHSRQIKFEPGQYEICCSPQQMSMPLICVKREGVIVTRFNTKFGLAEEYKITYPGDFKNNVLCSFLDIKYISH